MKTAVRLLVRSLPVLRFTAFAVAIQCTASQSQAVPTVVVSSTGRLTDTEIQSFLTNVDYYGIQPYHSRPYTYISSGSNIVSGQYLSGTTTKAVTVVTTTGTKTTTTTTTTATETGTTVTTGTTVAAYTGTTFGTTTTTGSTPIFSGTVVTGPNITGTLNPTGTDFHNAYADGMTALNIEAMAAVYEVSGSTAILNRMIDSCEKILSMRISFPAWTGTTEDIWLTPFYTTEEGDIVGHIAHTAKQILLNDDLWFQKPPGSSETYREIAIRYVQEAEKTTHYTANFIRSGSTGPQYWVPDNAYFDETGPLPGNQYDAWQPYSAVNHTGFGRNGQVPWNQQAMLSNGYQRLAECHELMGDNPPQVVLYDSYVQGNLDWWLANSQLYNFTSTATGQTTAVYKWGYTLQADMDIYPEDFGHGSSDIWGLERMYYNGRYDFWYSKVRPYSLTLAKVMTLNATSPYQFAQRVNGKVDDGVPRNVLPFSWMYLGMFDDENYTTVANAAIASGAYEMGKPWSPSVIMWMKEARYLGYFARPLGWIDQDIGSPGVVGSGSSVSGTFTIQGSGSNIGGNADHFNYTYQNTRDDLTLSIRVVNEQNTHPNALAGAMFRETVTGTAAGGSRYVGVFVMPNLTVQMKYRPNAGVNEGVVGTGTVAAIPCYLRLTRTGTTYRGAYSSDNVTWTELGQKGVAIPAEYSAGLALTSHANATLNTSTFDQVKFQPMNLAHWDIGNPCVDGVNHPELRGTLSLANGLYTMAGAGLEITGTADQFNYAFQPASGNSTVVARLITQQNTQPFAKAGIMIRETTAAGSKHVALYMSPDGNLRMQYRTTKNGSTGQITPIAISGTDPKWLRLVRSGTTAVVGYYSADGVSWTPSGTISITMPTEVNAGLAVCSRNNNVSTGTATFDNVSIHQ